ncbi:MAG: WD40 repeat domain-containing protein [Muribaculaceae bacterium]|nr:WD40 repeat domain-containing protein [Muribaculaceae bacterium]
MKFNAYTLANLFAGLSLAAGASFSANAAKPKKQHLDAPQPKSEYHFPQKATPADLLQNSTTVFNVFDHCITSSTGTEYFNLGKKFILSGQVNPARVNFLVIIKGKKAGKDNEAVLYNYNVIDDVTHRFSNKKTGNPTAATFSPDARTIIIGSPQGISLVETRKFKESGHIDSDFVPSRLLMSDNGYYLVASDSSRVNVYDFEGRKLRKSWDFGTKVNDYCFNNDNSEFAVLTDDGVLSIYDTRTFAVKKTIDDLGQGIACDYNFDGKYMSVAVSPELITVINLIKDDDRDYVNVDGGNLSRLLFVPDSRNNTLLAYNSLNSLDIKRMTKLEPYYGKLIADQVNDMMNEWLKMMPGETMEEYRARVTDESRARQRRLFEEEISTRLAGNPLEAANISLGKYDRGNGILAIDFDNMPTIFLPVPESEVGSFGSTDNLQFSDVKYGVMADDSFEIIYAKVFNRANGQTYTYDNLDRVPLSFMDGDDNVVSLEILQQQIMEEMKLQELRQKVFEEAKSQNVISDHTSITVDSRVEPAYNAQGDKILNYIIKFSYEVEPEFSVTEDFGPGKYHVDESGAASSMLRIVKEAFEGDLAQYIKAGKTLKVKIYGTADSSPIVRGIPYDGSYGEFENEPVYQDGQLTNLTVTTAEGIKKNEQLAFMRGMGVKDFLEKNVENLGSMNSTYDFHINVAEGKGGEFRRSTPEFTLVDAS